MPKSSISLARFTAPALALGALLSAHEAFAQGASALAPTSIEAPRVEAAPLVEAAPRGVSFESEQRPGEAAPALDVDGVNCVLPCRLPLSVGTHRVSVPGLFSQRVTLSSPEAIVEFRRPDRSRLLRGSLLIALGVVPVGLGGVALGVVGALLINGPGSGLFGTILRDGILSAAFGGSLFLASIAMVALGVLQHRQGQPRLTVRAPLASAQPYPRVVLGQGLLSDATSGALVPTVALRF